MTKPHGFSYSMVSAGFLDNCWQILATLPGPRPVLMVNHVAGLSWFVIHVMSIKDLCLGA